MSHAIDGAQRRYVLRTLGFMGGYVGVSIGVMSGALDGVRGTAAGWALAAVVAAPVAGQIWATLRLMAEADEFVGALTAKRFIAAAGLVFVLASLWGFGQELAGAPHAPLWLVYPTFWACFAVVSPFVRTTR